MAIYSQLSIAKKRYNGYLQLTVNSHFNVFWLMTVSVVIYLGYREKVLVIPLYLAEILVWLLLKHFFIMVRLRINDFPLRKWKKNVTIAKSRN